MLAARISMHICFKIVRLKSKINCVKTLLFTKKDKSIYIALKSMKSEIIMKLLYDALLNTSIIIVLKVALEFVMA